MLAKLGTLTEIQTQWSLSDLADAHALLDYQDELKDRHERELQVRLASLKGKL